MKITGLPNHAALRPLKIPAREVPHAVIEPAYTCNRRCAFCYSKHREEAKPFSDVVREIEQALEKRNLETISILGGEPTLYPRLADVVRSVKSRGLVCQILTNGLLLQGERGDELLDRLIHAGLDRIILHVDRGQGMTGDKVEAMRAELFAKFERRRLYFGLSTTLYGGSPGELAALLTRYSRFRFFDGVLATVARDMHEAAAGTPSPLEGPGMDRVQRDLARHMGLLPSSYIPSSLDDREARWLVYFYYINSRTGAAVPLSPAFIRTMRSCYRLLTGRHLFAVTMHPALSRVWFLLTALAEVLRRPSLLPRYVALAEGSRLLSALRFHYIVIQQPPEYDPGTGRLEICYHCPDATIRNGRLMPVCLADEVFPPGGSGSSDGRLESWAAEIGHHLEEADYLSAKDQHVLPEEVVL